jgi:membrane protease YdiL (CAAX protease family)
VTTAGLTAFARHAGCSQDELGIRAADAAAGLRLGLAAAAVAIGGVALGASLPATRPLFQDRRVTAVGRREAVYHLAVRIPLATALAEELAFRDALLGLVRRRRSPAPAVAWTSLLFGASHVLPTLKDYGGNPASGLVADPRQGRRIAVLATMLSTAGAGSLLPGCGCGHAACWRPSSPTPPPMSRPTRQADGWCAGPARSLVGVEADG